MALSSIDKKDYNVMIFQNETQVIAAETFLKKKGYDIKIISIPRKVSSGCGMALRIKKDNKNDILTILKDNNINYINLLGMEDL